VPSGSVDLRLGDVTLVLGDGRALVGGNRGWRIWSAASGWRDLSPPFPSAVETAVRLGDGASGGLFLLVLRGIPR
jgi:hypothetical protein